MWKKEKSDQRKEKKSLSALMEEREGRSDPERECLLGVRQI